MTKKISIGIGFEADFSKARELITHLREIGFEAVNLQNLGVDMTGQGQANNAATGGPPPAPRRADPSAAGHAPGRAGPPPRPPPSMSDDGGDDGRGGPPPAPDERAYSDSTPAVAGGQAAQGQSMRRRRMAGIARGTFSTAVGLGLGAGLMGFMFQSGSTFMRLDTILTQLRNRFGEVSDSIVEAGASMGYTIDRAAELSQIMGRATAAPDNQAFRRQAAFARITGQDPREVFSAIGAMEQISGLRSDGTARRITDTGLMAMLGGAQRTGMTGGRLPQYLGGISELFQEQLMLGMIDPSAPGKALQRSLGKMYLAEQVFGPNDERGRGGQATMQFLGQTNAMLRSGGAMETTLMRAMGFGRQGSDLDYITMRKRLDAGLHDERNLSSLMSYLGDTRGLGRQGMFRALEPFAKQAGMSAGNLDALVSAFDTAGERRRFNDLSADAQRAFVETMRADLSDDEREALRSGGIEGLMRARGGTIARGESRAVKLEGLQMATGDIVSRAMVDLTNTITTLAGTLDQLVGADIGKLVTSLTGGLSDLAGHVQKLVERMDRPSLLDRLRGGVSTRYPAANAMAQQQRGSAGVGE